MADDRYWLCGTLKLDAGQEAEHLKELTQHYSTDPSHNANALRRELWRINDTDKDYSPNTSEEVFSAYKSQGGANILALKKDSRGYEYLDLKTPIDATGNISDKTRGLFTTYDDPVMSINPRAASTYSNLGAFSETLIALAATKPEAIAKMIKDNGDGTATVTFPGAPKEGLTVSVHPKEPGGHPETDGGVAGKTNWQGTWPQAMTDAYEAYMRKHNAKLTDLSSKDFWDRDREESAEKEAYRLLTGRTDLAEDTLRYVFATESESTFDQRLNNAHKNNDPAVLYDTQAKEFRAVWDYDHEDKSLMFQPLAVTKRALGEILHGPRWILDPDQLFYPATDK